MVSQLAKDYIGQYRSDNMDTLSLYIDNQEWKLAVSELFGAGAIDEKNSGFEYHYGDVKGKALFKELKKLCPSFKTESKLQKQFLANCNNITCNSCNSVLWSFDANDFDGIDCPNCLESDFSNIETY